MSGGSEHSRHGPAGEAGWPTDLTRGVARVTDRAGRPAGTGFLVADRLLVTCAHVVADAGGEAPTGPVSVVFAHLDDMTRRAWVDPGLWRGPGAGDLAFLRLFDPPPAQARPLALGSARGVRSHPVKTYGFPANAPGDGHYGYGIAGDAVRGDGGTDLLQLTDCTEVTEGFSGGPVVDERTGLLIGMVDSVAAADRLDRGRATAYVTPVEVLRAVCQELSADGTCPYVGLQPFTTADAARFHGRERVVDAVLASLGRTPRFLALLGPSGSGKSSLVQAGVLPALARGALPGSDRWGWLTARPGTDPRAQLVHAGLRGAGRGLTGAVRGWLAAHPGRERLVLVLDQFEELLVAASSEPRAWLLEQLAELAEGEPAATVVVTMRDDFYSSLAAAAPALMPLVGRGLVNIPAVLTPGELAAIVRDPAAGAGLALEPGLTERIVRDAAGVTAPSGSAGAGGSVTVLPLLSSALTELWNRREDGRLTHDAYNRIGGVVGWLSRWSDRAYAEACHALPSDQRRHARNVITSLVRPGDRTAGTPPTRQRRTLDQLRTTGPGTQAIEKADTDAVVRALADQRLVTTGRDAASDAAVVELAHEALIHEWERLRRWLTEDHEFLAWRRDVEASHAQWRASAASRSSPDPELLLHGSALDAARRWRGDRAGELSADIARFIEESDSAERRRLTRDRRRVVVLAGSLVLVLLLGSVAALQAGRASRQAANAREQARLADSRRLAAEAAGLVDTRPDLAELLSLESLRTAPSQAAWASVGRALSRRVELSRVLYGHRASVASVAFSSDGGLLASVDSDHTIRLWDVAAGRPVGRPFPVGSSSSLSTFYDVAFSPATPLLATIGDEGVRLWDATTRKAVGVLVKGDIGLLGSVAFSPDGRLLAAAYGDEVRLWDVATRRPVGRPIDTRSGNLTDLAFSPDGETLATSSDVGLVRRWSVSTHRRLENLRVPMGASQVAFSPDGDTLATAGEKGVLYLWDLTAERSAGQLVRDRTPIRALSFSPDGKRLATADSQGVVRLWDLATRQPEGPPLLGHVGSVGAIAFSPDGSRLATAGADNTVRLWDFTARQPLGDPLTGHIRAVDAVAFSPDGKTLATGGFDTTTRLWNVASRDEVRTIGAPLDPNDTVSPDPVTDVAWSPDGRLLATAGDEVRLWDPRTGKRVGTLGASDDRQPELAWSPDGRLLAVVGSGPPATSGEETVRLWDVATRRPSGRALEVAGASEVAFSPDGTLLAVAHGRAVTLRNVATRTRVADLAPDTTGYEPISVLAWSPDGKLLATAGGAFGRTVRLWDVASHDPDGAPLPYSSGVQGLAFSPDGRLLATAGEDQTLRLWNVATRRQFGGPLSLHTQAVTAVAFNRDGTLLATGSKDGTARLWATPRTWTREACTLAGRNLTRAEWDRYVDADVPYVRDCRRFPSGAGAGPQAPAARYPSRP